MGGIKKKRYIIISIIFLFVIMVSLQASISVSPSLFELKIPLGKSFTDAIRIVNVTKSKTKINVYLSDFILNKNGNIKFLEAGTHKYSLFNYIRVNPKSLILDPGEEKWVRFTVKIPETFKGESQGILFFQTIPAKFRGSKGRQVLVSARIGTTIYAAGKQTVTSSSEISDIFFKKVFKDFSLKFALIYHNNGNIHNRPKGTLKLLNHRGEEIIKAPINKKSSSVLRNSHRIFEGQLQGNALEDGVYKIIAEIDYGKSILEVEKSVYFIKEGGIETFDVKYTHPEKSKDISKVILSAKVRGIKPEKADSKKFFRIKSLNGELLAVVPAKMSQMKKERGQNIINVTGEWTGELKKGIYLFEFLFFIHDNKPLTSFRKLIVKE